MVQAYLRTADIATAQTGLRGPDMARQVSNAPPICGAPAAERREGRSFAIASRIGVIDPAEQTNLMCLLERRGFGRTQLPLLHSSQPYLNVAGEEIRRRLLLTDGAEGQELCLRADCGIAVSAWHLAQTPAPAEASYA